MKILVIGGSYFLGRWFVQMAHKDHEITVLNRGNVPIGLGGVKEIVCDRHRVAEIGKTTGYDCIVDFCAYVKGDIESVANTFGHGNAKYIFVSTADVYEKGTGRILNEDSPLATSFPAGQEGAYIEGKVILETELREASESIGMKYTSVRPTILYGPANYAPREKMYFDWISQAKQIISPLNSDSFFQMLFVGDAVRGLIKLCETEDLKPSYNFCNETTENYDIFESALKEVVSTEFETIKLPVQQILENGIPLPFPLMEEESERYSADLFISLGVERTDLITGLKKTYKVYS